MQTGKITTDIKPVPLAKAAAATSGKNGSVISDNRQTDTVQQKNVGTVSEDNSLPIQAKFLETKPATVQQKSQGVVQRWYWPWNWGKKKEPDKYEGLDEGERRLALFGDSIAKQENLSRKAQKYSGGVSFDHGSQTDIEESIGGYYEHHAQSREHSDNPSEKTLAEKTGTISSVGSGVGSIITRLGSAIGNNALGQSGRITGAVGGGLGVLGSGLEAILDTKDIITSDEKKKDKLIKGLGVVGSLGNVVNAGASGIGQVADYLGGLGPLSHTAGVVAAPAGIIKGGSDLVTGLVGGGLAHYRSRKLAEEQNNGFTNEGIARFASENQWMKAKSNYGKALGGALGVAGGATLLALGLSNPIGWGLLAGAGAVGGAMALYNLYQKHKQGKALESEDYRDQLSRGGIEVPDDDMLERNKSWTDIFKTKASRRRDMVRGQIGIKLANNESQGFYGGDQSLDRISSHLGVSKLKNDEQQLFGDNGKKKARAKSYADALNF
ncbi:MAG: hypothetical protein NTW29_16865 [Bacteroidetes bacterium]|nr:hypothetical protein [Bacteroidota bacterium]